MSSNRRAVISLVVSAGICLIPRPFYSQDRKVGISHEISVSAVTLAVTVQDKEGRFIKTLAQKDFTIYENDKKQEINYFKYDYRAPLSLTVLLDVSGSMALQDKLKECKAALRDLIANLLTPQDEVSLLIFADGDVEVASKFSKDKDDFLKVLDKTEAFGQTALNDAVAVSPEFAKKGSHEKRALLLMTDGIENDSRSSPEQAVDIARRVDVPIYTIGYKLPLSEMLLEKHKRASNLTAAGIVEILQKFSLDTGGKAFFLNEPQSLYEVIREIQKELSHQYVIGYTSYRNMKDDYRQIKVLTSNKKYKVRTRKGY